MTYYLGIMSGTSLDGVDIALTDIQSNQTKLIAADFTPMPANLREKVTALIQSGEISLQALGELDHQFGLLYADCVNAFLHKTSVKTRADRSYWLPWTNGVAFPKRSISVYHANR